MLDANSKNRISATLFSIVGQYWVAYLEGINRDTNWKSSYHATKAYSWTSKTVFSCRYRVWLTPTLACG